MSNNFEIVVQPSLVSGVARVLDFGAVFDSYNNVIGESMADYSALENDWKIIGNDLKISIESYITSDEKK